MSTNWKARKTEQKLEEIIRLVEVKIEDKNSKRKGTKDRKRKEKETATAVAGETSEESEKLKDILDKFDERDIRSGKFC